MPSTSKRTSPLIALGITVILIAGFLYATYDANFLYIALCVPGIALIIGGALIDRNKTKSPNENIPPPKN